MSNQSSQHPSHINNHIKKTEIPADTLDENGLSEHEKVRFIDTLGELDLKILLGE